MTLPLFDEPTDQPPRSVTLIRLAGEIARSVGTVGRIAVEGEVYRPNTARGGAVYFVLKDRAAQMDVRVPAAQARRARVAAGERAQVIGSLQWMPERGAMQLVAESVSPVGEGAIAAHIADIRRRLAAEGLLDRQKRRLPVLPQRIGVICGTEAAVRRDIESVVAARCPGYPVLFRETTVSGGSAAMTISEAIVEVGGSGQVDVLILARGGGDAPSLLPWSSEDVCRAVAACPVPVVSAIGHESDRPLCDELADLRCGTPSLAATSVVPDLGSLRRALDDSRARAAAGLAARVQRAAHRLDAVDVAGSVDRGLDRAAERLERCRIRMAGGHPARALEQARGRLARCDYRRPVWEGLGRASGQLQAEGRHLRALSPQRTLERGYAVVRAGSEGTVVRRAGTVSVGEGITAVLAVGSLTATVVAVDAGEGRASDG